MKMKQLMACICASALMMGTVVPAYAGISTREDDTVINATVTGEGDEIKLLIILSDEARETFKEDIAEALQGASAEEIQRVTEKAFNTIDAVEDIMYAAVPVAEESNERKPVSFTEIAKVFNEDPKLSVEDLGIDSTAEVPEIKVTKSSGVVNIDIEKLEFKTEFLAFGALIDRLKVETEAEDPESEENQLITAKKKVMDPLRKKEIHLELTVDEDGNINDSLGLTDPQTIFGKMNPSTGIVEYFRLSDYVEYEIVEEYGKQIVKLTIKALPYDNTPIAFIGPKEGITLDTIIS